jgi:hypothetical protein
LNSINVERGVWMMKWIEKRWLWILIGFISFNVSTIFFVDGVVFKCFQSGVSGMGLAHLIHTIVHQRELAKFKRLIAEELQRIAFLQGKDFDSEWDAEVKEMLN